VGISLLQRLPAVAFLAIAATVAAAPPRYVDDAACTSCHAGIVRSYEQVGMSKSFYRPRPGDGIEDFGKLPFRHERSGDVMELRWRKGQLVFRRWQVDAAGKSINAFEQVVDWILGSGHHARTYLYQTPNGELYQLPLAWYSQTKEWAMAPGYDRRDHEGVLRRARRECLFCHNAYADVAGNARDGYWRNQGLPTQLPEGIGCQRCHGPGAEHVRQASSPESDPAAVRLAIIRPTRLDADLSRDVCYQCHMQPSVAIPGIRRFGRDIDSFQPGQRLSSYLLRADITDRGIARDDRFEINHHPYRLEQSRCFRESAGRVSCLSCHDPHRKVADGARAEHYRAVCMGCHAGAHRPAEDCTSCHMPKRRTQDVVHVVMTDHKIARPSDTAALLAPRQEREPAIEDIELSGTDLEPAEKELYRVVAAMRAGSGQDSARRLEQLLAATASPHIEPYFDLAAAQLRQKRAGAVETTTRLILDRVPNHPLALEWLGFSQASRDAAIESLREAARLDPLRVETQFNLGLNLAARGDRAEAAGYFERALAGRPNFVLAWIHLGDVRSGDAATAAYRRALEIDPTSTRAYVALARALRAQGHEKEALRYLRHGAAFAAKPELVRAEMPRAEMQ
jgi:predicted CXXCH cytochrome family protein